MLVNALVIPYLTYCSTAWCNSSPTLLKQLQKLYDRSQNFSLMPLKSLENVWLKNMTITTFKAIHGLVPEYLCKKVSLSKLSHTHNTRFSSNNSLKVKINGNKFWKRSFQYRAPLAWNALSNNLKNTPSFLKFKTDIKKSFNL